MSIFQSIVLGLVQGLTEFIPVSSSGHLLIVPALFGWGAQSLAFDTTLHLGTSLALVVYFYNDLKDIVLSFLSDGTKLIFSKKLSFSDNTLLGFKLILGSIPALLLGFLFNDYFENTFRAVSWTILFLFLGSILMFFAEYLMGTCKDSKKISFYKAISIGLFQSLALFPGFSRSGATISGGVLLGLSKESAARFSFLLSLPIILSAGIYQLLSINFSEFVNLELLFGLVSSFLSGLFAIRFLLGFLKSNKLYPFIIYRILLVLFLLLYKIY